MGAGFDQFELKSLARLREVAVRLGKPRASPFRRYWLWLSSALLIGCGAWALLPASNGHARQGGPPHLELAAIQSEPSTAGAPGDAAVTAARSAAAAELDRLRISSQTWRRGGLGSKALVTFTLRNDNDYAVKDIEIRCSFSRGDGSHLTERRRVFPETVNMKSRKTFARELVGFVNVNARQAKCSLTAAQRA